jgi:hypothetical protein
MAATEDRKVFPMTAFLRLPHGEGYDANKQGIKEMLAYVAGMPIDATSELFAAALAKAWIYEQNPELTGIAATRTSSARTCPCPSCPRT